MKKNTTLLLFILIYILPTTAQIRLPHLVNDGMVLQRDEPIHIWGWSTPGETISIEFRDSLYQTIASEKGQWKIQLAEQKAGGPFKMELKGKNKIILNNILVGDVWLCSGQSNMELPMRRVEPHYRTEIKNINTTTTIRQFTVPKIYNFNQEAADISGGEWLPATQDNIMNFSAVGYFFAEYVQKNQNVPIGLINSSLGGSPVEAWINEDALKPFPDAWNELQKFKDTLLIKKIQESDRIRNNNWFDELAKKDKGHQGKTPWSSPLLNDLQWDNINIPGYWNNSVIKKTNGAVWFRRKIHLPASMHNKAAHLEMGRIVDADSIFVNGYYVGSTSYQYPPRWYHIPENILKEGDNTIVVKVISQIGVGGFVPDKTYAITTAKDTVDLKGKWKYKVGATMSPLKGPTFIRWKPSGLYNAMIHPLFNYRIKGAIWYQGESNVGEAQNYQERLTSMVNNWRREWNQGDFPFLIVQLANYLANDSLPVESNMALLRDAQYKVSSQVTNSAMASAIDLGEWNDIHPLNKKEVGKRLALAAEKTAYKNSKIVCSGPVCTGWKIKKSKFELQYSHIGHGLTTNNNAPLAGYAIAGEDGKFIWAKAKIKGSKVIVWNESIKKPTAVRYGWANNPANANLYNQEGLPAIPFRTDK